MAGALRTGRASRGVARAPRCSRRRPQNCPHTPRAKRAAEPLGDSVAVVVSHLSAHASALLRKCPLQIGRVDLVLNSRPRRRKSSRSALIAAARRTSSFDALGSSSTVVSLRSPGWRRRHYQPCQRIAPTIVTQSGRRAKASAVRLMRHRSTILHLDMRSANEHSSRADAVGAPSSSLDFAREDRELAERSLSSARQRSPVGLQPHPALQRHLEETRFSQISAAGGGRSDRSQFS